MATGIRLIFRRCFELFIKHFNKFRFSQVFRLLRFDIYLSGEIVEYIVLLIRIYIDGKETSFEVSPTTNEG